MSRFLLSLCLFLIAAVAMAGNTPTSCACPETGVKPDKGSATSVSQDCDATTTGQPAVQPARASTPRAVSPRWHSLLPGMIR